MGNVRLRFDDKILSGDQVREVNTVLKSRRETVIKVPTNAKELKTGVVSKTELSPEVVMAETLTIVRERGCLTSILNMNDEEVKRSVSPCL
jgi:hypothetical protein